MERDIFSFLYSCHEGKEKEVSQREENGSEKKKENRIVNTSFFELISSYYLPAAANAVKALVAKS